MSPGVVYCDAIRRPDILYVAVDRGGGDIRGFEQSRDYPKTLIGQEVLRSVLTWGDRPVVCFDETAEILRGLGVQLRRIVTAGRQPALPTCDRTHVSWFAKTKHIGLLKRPWEMELL